MTDGSRFGLAPSRITLSTVGVIPNMLQLTRDMPSIQLALSLHAPTQELRQQIVPTAKSWPLEKLIDAMDYFILRSKKRILIEYVMLEGVNDGDEQAHQLGRLLKGKDVVSGAHTRARTHAHTHTHPPAQAQQMQRTVTQRAAIASTMQAAEAWHGSVLFRLTDCACCSALSLSLSPLSDDQSDPLQFYIRCS